MWPFKKKQEKTYAEIEAEFQANKTPEQLDQDRALAYIHRLAYWRDIGDEFEYLGRRMVVVKHHRVDTSSGVRSPFVVTRVPELHARYADDHGVFHDLVLSAHEALALIERESPATDQAS